MTAPYMINENNSLTRTIKNIINKKNNLMIDDLSIKYDAKRTDKDYFYLECKIPDYNNKYKGEFYIRIPRIDKNGNKYVIIFPLIDSLLRGTNDNYYGLWEDCKINGELKDAKFANGCINGYELIGPRYRYYDYYTFWDYHFTNVRVDILENPIGLESKLVGNERYVSYRYIYTSKDMLYEEDHWGVPFLHSDPTWNKKGKRVPIETISGLKDKIIKHIKDKWGDDYSGSIPGWNLDGVVLVHGVYAWYSGLGQMAYRIHLFMPPNGVRPCGYFDLCTKEGRNFANINTCNISMNNGDNNDDISGTTCIGLQSMLPHSIASMLDDKLSFLDVLYYYISVGGIKPVIRNNKELYVMSTARGIKKGDYKISGLSTQYSAYSGNFAYQHYAWSNMGSDWGAYQYTVDVSNHGFDIGKIFKEEPLIMHSELSEMIHNVNSREPSRYNIRNVIYNKFGVLLPDSKKGLEVKLVTKEESGEDYDLYTFTVKSFPAAVFFIKDTKFTLKHYYPHTDVPRDNII